MEATPKSREQEVLHAGAGVHEGTAVCRRPTVEQRKEVRGKEQQRETATF